MRKTLLLGFMLLFLSLVSRAGRVSGQVTDAQGIPLPYASVFVKGTSLGTTANNEGRYFLDLGPGQYIIVCQFVGYTRQEKNWQSTDRGGELNFSLSLQETSMKEVVVHAGGEDPAYEIIRNAIRKKEAYAEPLDSFTCEAYIKTLIRTRHLPKRILGQKIESNDKREMGVDSLGKGIIFLSESLTKIAFKKPGKLKLEVISGRESGSNGFGFNFPTFINFYSNNVTVFASRLNPRGFVSPLADAAMNYYRFKYLGSFIEDGKEINQIRVIPRRKFEPLFSGTINITEGDWRIHSLELTLTKESQLQLLDTLRIKQLQVPVAPGIWKTKDQVVYFAFNQLGIDAVGNFLNIYNKYDTQPKFPRKYFNNVVVLYDTAVNKKSRPYWDSLRPVPLEPEEAVNYQVKDSLYQVRRDSVRAPRYIDSLRKHQGKASMGKIFWKGYTHSDFEPDNPLVFRWAPLIKGIEFNSVEGWVLKADASWQRNGGPNRGSWSFSPHLRYGWSNGHLNGWASWQYSHRTFNWDEQGGTASRNTWTLSAGKRISQFNHEEPITPLINSLYTLLDRENYLKVYENIFGEMAFNRRFDNSLRIGGDLLFEKRSPLENSTDFSILQNGKAFTPNYPFEKLNGQFREHQALIFTLDIQFKPGQRYIQLPHNKIPIGSKYPFLSFNYQKGIPSLLGSGVNFDKWRFSIWDDINFKLKGLFKYRVSLGGFLNRRSVFIQDYQHFNGNQVIFAGQYLNSFQLAPYYANSTTATFFVTAHLEQHFNGLLTNKIPLFRRLNWFLVGGANAFYVNSANHYEELFAGLENILKILRLDLVASYSNGNQRQFGLRLGFGGLIGGSIQRRR